MLRHITWSRNKCRHQVDVHAGLLYDAFLLWATSLNNGLHVLPEEYSIQISKAILRYLRNVSFEGRFDRLNIVST